MATSGVRDTLSTALSVVTQALRKIQVGTGGEPLDEEDSSIGLDALNAMIRTWAADGVRLWLTETQSVAVVAATATYTLSSRPLDVLMGYRRTSDQDTPMRMVTREEYQRLPNKTSAGTPFLFWPNRTRTTTTVSVYPVPAAADVTAGTTLRFDVKRQIEDVTATGQEAELPAEWLECLIYNLAVRVAPEFGKTPSALVTAMALDLYNQMSGQDREASLYMRLRPYR